GPTVLIAPPGVWRQKLSQLRFHGLLQQLLRAFTQQLGQRITHRAWLLKSNNRILTHGVPTPMLKVEPKQLNFSRARRPLSTHPPDSVIAPVSEVPPL